MSQFSPGVEDALSQTTALVFTAVEILLPGYTLRLVDGSSEIDFLGKTFVGLDPIYGTLAGIEPLTDGSDSQAPAVRLGLLPPTNAATADLAGVEAQGSEVSIWYGTLDLDSGIVSDDPDLVFSGELDVPTLKVGKNGRILELDVVSVWDRFFRDDEGARLTDAFHQAIWPGELGLEFVTDVQRQLPWGADQPRPTNVRDVPNYGGGWFGPGVDFR